MVTALSNPLSRTRPAMIRLGVSGATFVSTGAAVVGCALGLVAGDGVGDAVAGAVVDEVTGRMGWSVDLTSDEAPPQTL